MQLDLSFLEGEFLFPSFSNKLSVWVTFGSDMTAGYEKHFIHLNLRFYYIQFLPRRTSKLPYFHGLFVPIPACHHTGFLRLVQGMAGGSGHMCSKHLMNHGLYVLTCQTAGSIRIYWCFRFFWHNETISYWCFTFSTKRSKEPLAPK